MTITNTTGKLIGDRPLGRCATNGVVRSETVSSGEKVPKVEVSLHRKYWAEGSPPVTVRKPPSESATGSVRMFGEQRLRMAVAPRRHSHAGLPMLVRSLYQSMNSETVF